MLNGRRKNKSILRSKLFRKYITFSSEHRGLTEDTLVIHKRWIAPFLTALRRLKTPSTIHRLQAHTIHDYMIKTLKPLSRANRKHFTSSLRSFLRFAHLQGYLGRSLVEAVPSVPSYKLATIPRAISWDSVKKLLSAPDRRTHLGRRDYAILQLLATYGVRIGQALSLRLSDIKWKEGVIHFQASKRGKPLYLPLQKQVAEALLNYIRRDRHHVPFPHVFLSYRGKPMTGDTFGPSLKSRFKYSGIELPVGGLHTIRHAFATRLMEQGTPIKTIADLLGHRLIRTTFIYTKVDIRHLRILAREWPEAAL